MLAYPAQAEVGPGTLCHRSESPLRQSPLSPPPNQGWHEEDPCSAGWVCPPEGIEEGVCVDVCVRGLCCSASWYQSVALTRLSLFSTSFGVKHMDTAEGGKY